LNSGMGLRDEEVAESKAQGRCGPDTLTCDDGSIVERDPEHTCRFASCGTSLIQEGAEQPTFQWTGVSIDDNQNFCARMTPILGDYQDLHVTSCAAQGTGTACTNHYEHVTSGRDGDIRHCRENAGACEAGAVHNCTWSFYMEDLISKHSWIAGQLRRQAAGGEALLGRPSAQRAGRVQPVDAVECYRPG